MSRDALPLIAGVGTRHAEPQGPVNSDLIITPDDHLLRGYTIAQLPGRPQVRWTSREEALAFAKRFAHRHAVDVWVTEDLTTTRVVCHRPPGYAHPAEASPMPHR